MSTVFVRLAKPHMIYKEEGVDEKGTPYDIHLTGYDPIDGEPTCPVFEVETTPKLRAALNEGTHAGQGPDDRRLIEIRDETEAKAIVLKLEAEREARLKANPIQQMSTVSLTREVYDRLVHAAAAGNKADPDVARLAAGVVEAKKTSPHSAS